MATTKEIDVAKFEKLLVWLDEDREAAGRKYESIRHRLIYFFRGRKCSYPDELADKTIDRVTQKIEKLVETYEGDPIRYFFSVAKNILHEYFRLPQPQELTEFIPQPETPEKESERENCLAICLQTITDTQRQLFIGYYQTDKNHHIQQRKQLAQELKISDGNLRRKVNRLKNALQKCVLNCLEKKKV